MSINNIPEQISPLISINPTIHINFPQERRPSVRGILSVTEPINVSTNTLNNNQHGLSLRQYRENTTVMDHNAQIHSEQPCSICQQEFDDVHEIKEIDFCNHFFHTDCLEHWLELHNTCPICRQLVTPNTTTTPTLNNSISNIIDTMITNISRTTAT